MLLFLFPFAIKMGKRVVSRDDFVLRKIKPILLFERLRCIVYTMYNEMETIHGKYWKKNKRLNKWSQMWHKISWQWECVCVSSFWERNIFCFGAPFQKEWNKNGHKPFHITMVECHARLHFSSEIVRIYLPTVTISLLKFIHCNWSDFWEMI